MALNMSYLIAADAPLLATTDGEQSPFSPTELFEYPFYSLPPSPTHSDQPSPLRTPDPEPVCFPTHQVFDLAEVTLPSTPSSFAIQGTTTIASTDSDPLIVATGGKRSASPAPSVTKKRAVGERVSSKDFVPPDVSGLSKREARLVKNRAAAFLSRQRKREEFECMEIRVAELEQENKRLLALTQQNEGQVHTSAAAAPSDKLTSEVESLKAQLAAAQERAQALSAQLEQKNEAIVKVESRDIISTAPSASSPPRATVLPSAHKSSASLGLMVLLCALPSLLSMRIQSPPSAIDDLFAVSNTFHASGGRSAFDFDFDNSMFAPNDFDWSYSTPSSFVDLDGEDTSKMSSRTRRLEFTGINPLEGETGLGNLGDLDISFDTAPSDDGKIRVRIHPTSSSASSTTSRSVSRGTTPEGEDSPMSASASSTSSPRSRPSALGVCPSSFLSTTSKNPFLGVSSLSDTDDIDMMYSDSKDANSSLYGSTFDRGSSFLRSLSSSLSSLGGDYGVLDKLNSGKRRVRIALKSAPQAASEGGEWEVQIC